VTIIYLLIKSDHKSGQALLACTGGSASKGMDLGSRIVIKIFYQKFSLEPDF
jgi:hypothetical protein